MEDQLILVNENDEETGNCGKLEAHEKGLLHRAFSIFIFRKTLVDNPDGTRTFHNQLLIQRRAPGKYHSAGLWANSCCSHPRKGETLQEATARRLEEETGMVPGSAGALGGISEKTGQTAAPPDAICQDSASGTVLCPWKCSELEEMGAFVYRADFDNGLTEHELDHVFTGWVETDFAGNDWPGRNPDEASEMIFEDVDVIMKDVLTSPGKYSAWFMPALMIATEGQQFDYLNRETSDRLIY